MAFYNLAWNASRLPFGLFRQVVDSVLVPTFSANRGDPQLVACIVREVLDHAYVVLLPVSAWLIVSADSLVTTVFGEKWLPLVPCLQVMSMAVLLWPATAVFSGLLVATEQAHRVAVATASQLVVLLVLVPVLAYHGGLLGAAFADAGSMLTVTVILYGVIRMRFRDLRLDLASATALPAAAAGAAALLGWMAGAPLSHPGIRLLVQTLTLASAYVGCLWVLDRRGRLLRVLMAVRGAIRTRRRPAAGW
jgi:O-antigen/teichoic acid export membrane protein